MPRSHALTIATPFLFPMTGHSQPQFSSATTTMQAHSQPQPQTQAHSFAFPSAASSVGTAQKNPTTSSSPSPLPSPRSAFSSYTTISNNALVAESDNTAPRVSSSSFSPSSSSLPYRLDADSQLYLAKQDDDVSEDKRERNGSGILNPASHAFSSATVVGHMSPQSQSMRLPSEGPIQEKHERQPIQTPLPHSSPQLQSQCPFDSAYILASGQLVRDQTSPSASEIPNQSSMVSQPFSPGTQSHTVPGDSKARTKADVANASLFADTSGQNSGVIDTAGSCTNARPEQVTNEPAMAASKCSVDTPSSKPTLASTSAQILATANDMAPTQHDALPAALPGSTGAEEAVAILTEPSNEPVPLPIPELNSKCATGFQFSGVQDTTTITQDTAILNSALENYSGLYDFPLGRSGSTDPDTAMSAAAIFGPTAAGAVLSAPNLPTMYHQVVPLGTASVDKVDALELEAPAQRLVRFPENHNTCISVSNGSRVGSFGNKGRLDTDEDGTAIAAPGSEPRIQAFAKLEFDDGHFYVNTYSLILGRDVRAARAALQRAVRARERNRAVRHGGRKVNRCSITAGANSNASLHGTNPLFDASDNNRFMAESLVSDRGGIMGFDPDGPQQPPAVVSWQSTNPSGSNEPSRPVLRMGPANLPPLPSQDFFLGNLHDDPMQRDYDALSIQSLLVNNAVESVDTLSLLPSPDACPLIPIHPPASANHDGMLSLHKGISRKHVKICYNFDKSVFEMEVMGRNGAFIGPDWLSPGQTRPLSSGDYIQISGVRVRFVLPDEPNLDVVTEPTAGPTFVADDALYGAIEERAAPALAMKEKKKRDAAGALLSDGEANANTETTKAPSNETKKRKKRIKLKVSLPPSMHPEKADKYEARKHEKARAKELEKEDKVKEEKERRETEEKAKVKEREEKEKQAQEDHVFKTREAGQQEKQQRHQQQQGAQEAMRREEKELSDSRPSEETTPPATIMPDGTVVQQPQVPAKRRGPGRPPKDGIMSKRERAELAREQRLAAKREANGGITPPPAPIRATGGKMAKESSAFAASSTPLGAVKMISLEPDASATAVRQEKEKRKYNKRKKQESLPGESTVFLSIENSTIPRFGDFGRVDAGSSGTGVMMTQEQSANITLPPPSKKRKPSRSPSPNYPPESAYSAEDLAKPPYNYAVLIFDALSESQAPMTLKQIYRALKLKYPYFRFRCETEGWTSSVRHNLNGNSHLFEHAERDGKGWSWKLISGASIDKEKKRRPSPQPVASHSSAHIAPSQTPQPQPVGVSVAAPYGAQPPAQTFSTNATMNVNPEQRTALPFQFPPAIINSQYQNTPNVQSLPPARQPSYPPAQTSTPTFATSSTPVSQLPSLAALRCNFPPSFATNSTSTYQSPYASAPPPEVLQQLRKASEASQNIQRMPPSMPQALQQQQQQQEQQQTQQTRPLQQHQAPPVAQTFASNLPRPSPAPVPASAPAPVQNPASATIPALLPSTNVSAGQAPVPAPSYQNSPFPRSRPNLSPSRSIPQPLQQSNNAPISAAPTSTLAPTSPAPPGSVSFRPGPLSVPPSIHSSAPQPVPASMPQGVTVSVPTSPSVPYNYEQQASSASPRTVPSPKTSMWTTAPAAPAARPSTTVSTTKQTPAAAATSATTSATASHQAPQETGHSTESTVLALPLSPPPQPQPWPRPQVRARFQAMPQFQAEPQVQTQPRSQTQTPQSANLGNGNVSLKLAHESACFFDRANAAVDNFESVLMEDADDQDYLRQVLRSARNRVLHGATGSSFSGGEPKDEAVIIDAIRRIIGGLRE